MGAWGDFKESGQGTAATLKELVKHQFCFGHCAFEVVGHIKEGGLNDGWGGWPLKAGPRWKHIWGLLGLWVARAVVLWSVRMHRKEIFLTDLQELDVRAFAVV